MSNESTNYKIDDREYSKHGTVKCRHGSGDSEETWQYTVLCDQENTRYLLGVDKNKWWFYKETPLKWSSSLIDETYEECPVDVMEGPGFSLRDVTMTWVRLKERFDQAQAPFQESPDAMIVDPKGKARVFVAVPLVIKDEKNYLSARFPAEKHPRELVPFTRLSSLAKSSEIFGGSVMIAFLLWGAAGGVKLPLTTFWWLGAICMVLTWFLERGGAFYGLSRLIAGAFFIHFATHGVDVYLGEDWEELRALAFESTRAAALIGCLLVCRFVWLRGYAVLTDGGLLGGGCAWWTFVGGLSLVSMVEEFSYFPWFSWYAGTSPWGYIWPFFLGLGLWHDWDDYKNAPLAKRDMKSSLFKIAEALENGLQAVGPRVEDLALRCDDLEDAVKISNDPAVVGLLKFGPSFIRLRDALHQFKELDLEDLTSAETELLDQDLKITGSDLKEILADFRSWGTPDFSAKSPRVSSFLLTRSH